MDVFRSHSDPQYPPYSESSPRDRWLVRTWSVAQAERLDSEEDVGGLRHVELVLQGADGSVFLQEEAALCGTVMPILGRRIAY